ncbi:tethering factor for nuclear proteasome STS1 [Maniola jurtina]|uniref:tethering factor for nuclear proteasome STS1 n=1 Tax=Maniola jurtina TaxID=191418 RepID=UPI001E68BB2D|nr:tethering factor for nuclear proteasome STS1 [Maniola jurtina]XP_045774088.1 tethering factor for nuclear proteasome STS1 [Maniola jurtina]XP_045774089.1 tethering factor for nuclear proteasome STS1 [Maniola jurtina]
MEAAPDTPRRTRAALAEIPVRLERLLVTPLQPVTNTREVSPSLPPGYLSPAPSPDEFIIQQRGRKRLPTTWSPDIETKRDAAIHSTVRTPPKSPGRSSPIKVGVTLRSTPRKSLLGERKRIPLTPEKIDFSDISTPPKFKINSPAKGAGGALPIKRTRLDKTFDREFKAPLDIALKGLNTTQLIHLIKKVIQKHPEMEQEILQDMPAPDLTPCEEKLSYLTSNIFKSLPTSRLASKTDSRAYSRVAIHLSEFKKCLVKQGKLLVESQHWESVMKYVFLAWNYVRATPVWDNQPHNAQRKQCFKALTNFCLTALKKGEFSTDFYSDAQEKLHNMEADSEEIQTCLIYVNRQLLEY